MTLALAPPPSDWIITVDTYSRRALALNANPTRIYLTFLVDYSPLFDIASERVSEYLIEDRGTRGLMFRQYVSQFASESKCWKAFVDSIVNQFDLVCSTQIAVCKDAFGLSDCSATS